MGLVAERQVGRPTDKILVVTKLLKFFTGSAIGTFTLFNITTILLYSIRISSKAYFKVCFEVRKILLPFFSSHSLLFV